MSKMIDRLSKAQQIVLATFFGILGAILTTLPFYIGGKEMIKPTGIEYEWTNVHYIFLVFGIVFIAISLRLSRLDKLFGIGTGILSKWSGKKKGDENAS